MKTSTKTKKKVAPKKAVPKKSRKSETTQQEEVAQDVSDEVDGSPQFRYFPKLSTELRLKIWGLASPDPYLVVQRQYIGARHSHSYNRPVPAVLHACRESRHEFMELEDGSIDTSLARRKREHPVYKLSFMSKTRSSPIFFSEIDSFWGRRYAVIHPVWQHQYSGIASLDMSKNLRHLVLSWDHRMVYNHEWRGARYLYESFPRLETLTLLLQYSLDSNAGPLPVYLLYANIGTRHDLITIGPTIPPEINQEMNASAFPSPDQDRMIIVRAKVLEMITEGKEEYPDWNPPEIKLRFRQQFMERNGLDSGAGWQSRVDTDSDSDSDEDEDEDEEEY